jgi:hypothetical protein
MAYTTYFDLVESLIVSSYGGPQDAEQRDIRTAIHRAYDELTTIRDWAYYHVHGRVILQAPYDTGSVTSSGVTVTLTGGTWPSWAATGAYLKVGEEICRVATRTSNSVIVLDSALSLKANVTASPYILYRTVYPLPSDFRNLDEPSDEYNWWSGLYVTPDQAMKLERVSNSSGEPYHWTVVKDPDSTGWAIKVIGYPTGTQTLDFTYRRTARPIRWSGHETNARAGTITSQYVAPVLDVNGAGTNFQASMAGSILRIGDASNHPGPIESLTPYTAEMLILSVNDNEELTTQGSLELLTPTKYLITDPIDVASHMAGAMDSACDYWLARIRGTGEDKAFSMYQRDLRLAMEQDQLAPLSGRSRNVWHDGGWRSPLQADVG